MTNQENLVERVTSDPDRKGFEKETSVSMCGNEKQMTIHSAKKTIVKSLLKNDHFEPEWFTGKNDQERTVRVDASEVDALNDIHSVSGKAPVGLLNIKSKPRSNNHQSSIVNHKSVDPEAFA